MIFNTLSSINPQLLVIAYLDPGSGSFLIQLLIAGVVGAGVLIKIYWKKITRLFNRNAPKEEDVTSKDDDDASIQQ